ncbi:hypothetical protein BCR35DRAFT_350658 [Leucosporidium creatinivorum]|uniref:Uncharacterized protein n=1 Tax=Leucosporidium creatinivorum TaxID=106004 RepID=A0A1Y2G054_9BASI|nr:hypothetical protein BCR35DRAFT_350658 [Leucosporidium creatinivorum]
MLLARATCSALRIAQRPAANALAIPSRLLGAASSLKSSSLYQTTSSRLLSTSTSLRNSSEASSPPPPAPTSSEEGIQADRSSVDPLSEPFATDQEPSQTPLASTTPSSSPSLDDPAASSTDRAPIDIFKPRGDESQPSPSNRVFVKGSAFDKHEEWLVNEVAKALDLERTQLTVWRPSSDGVEGRRRGYGWIDLPTAEDAEKLVSLAPTFGGRPLAWAFATSPRTSDTLIVSAPSPPSSQIPSTQNALTPRLRSIIKRVAERSPDSRSSATALSSSLNGVFFRDLSVDITEAQLKLAVVTALAIEDGDVLS